MKISKFKWMWIKFWGNHFVMVSPNNSKIVYILYHHRVFEKDLWDKHFKEVKK